MGRKWQGFIYIKRPQNYRWILLNLQEAQGAVEMEFTTTSYKSSAGRALGLVSPLKVNEGPTFSN